MFTTCLVQAKIAAAIAMSQWPPGNVAMLRNGARGIRESVM
ncbi:hypothetical protein [Paraburkholderia ginsengiterrae]|nr:hypothetical protein [Paraburkholderia ginsengiterrae]